MPARGYEVVSRGIEAHGAELLPRLRLLLLLLLLLLMLLLLLLLLLLLVLRVIGEGLV